MNRDKSIDILKGIGILFVIMGHIQRYIPQHLLVYIYSFHMPLFFYVSGYLYKSKYEEMTVKEYSKKRALQLIYPYLTLNIVNFLWTMLKTPSLDKMIKYIFSFLYSNYIFDTNYVGAIWFLLCLFMVEFIYFIIKKKKSNKILNISLICCLILGIIISQSITIKYFRLPFWIDIALFGIIFYHFGFLTKKLKDKIMMSTIRKICLLILCIVVNIICIYFNYKYCINEKFLGRCDMLYLFFGNYIYFYVGALAGIWTWQIVSELIKENLILEYFGKNTLLIMQVHLIVWQSLEYILKNIVSINNNMIMFGISLLIVSIISLLVSVYIKKYMLIVMEYKKLEKRKVKK